MMIFDTHAHYDDEAFDQDREELIAGLKGHGIGTVVNIGAGLKSSQNTLDLVEKYPFFYGTVGVHPSETAELDEAGMEWLRASSKTPGIVAIGEIGLDYYWDEPDRKNQKRWFVSQLELAREQKLPVVIHSRDAAKDTLDILKAERAEETGGVIHCFSYGVEMAGEYLDMGFYLGVGGVVTFSNARKLKEVVAYMPLERLVLETDSPYLAPSPNRGKRNESSNLSYVVDAIADIRGISREQVIEITEQNGRNLYRIGEQTRCSIR